MIGRPLAKGDVFSTGEISKGKISKLNEEPFFDTVFRLLDGSLLGLELGNVKFKVLKVVPSEGAVIDYNTEFIFKDKIEEEGKSRIIEYTESYMGPFEEKMESINNIKELEKLKDKVSSIKVRVSYNVVRTLIKFKFDLMKKIDNKIRGLKKERYLKRHTYKN